MANDNRDTRLKEAERRRSLEVNTQFQNLGEPIQKLLLQLAQDVSSEEIQMFSKVTVRQLAKVYDMLNLEEDPEKILAWLRREAMKARGKEVPDGGRVKDKVRTGASRDPIGFYKELERKNMDLMEKFKKDQEDREQLRSTNIAERRQRRAEAQAKAQEERAQEAKTGESTDSVARLKKTELADIMGTFERFTAKNSTFDNSNSNQDTEWWKKDEYRRDFEKNGPKGKLWTRVVEGGTQQVPDSELHVREEWYRSQCWWKADKYRRDWLASREAEWWKEETYIRDWQDNGDKGVMWTAADEITGFNRKGNRRPAAKAELARRVEWYKNNGPKGIVKMWCALTEGSHDRCTLEEKRERDDFYKNGDWWKSDVLVHKFREQPTSCAAFTKAGASAVDGEWWKDETYRKDFERGGTAWKAASEKAAVTKSDQAAPRAEAERREEWYKTNWWKSDKAVEDFKKNGSTGKVWRAASAADGDNKTNKYCNAIEIKMREEWLRSADDREWWKDETLIRDWEENGAKGKRWTAGWSEASAQGTGDVNRASDAELAKREKYFQQNWWKQDKYVKDFVANGSKGAVWKAASAKGHHDHDWWKQEEFHGEWVKAQENKLEPFYADPKFIADYWKNGATGKKWTAAHAAAGSVNLGQEIQANQEELAEREQFYQKNWWRQEELAKDFAINGKKGKLWRAANADGTGVASAQELRERQEYYDPQENKKFRHGFASMLEADAGFRAVADAAPAEELAKREEYFEENWWKSPEVAADYLAFGSKSKLLRSATLAVACSNLGNEADFQASEAEVARRMRYFDQGQVDAVASNQFTTAELASHGEFWENPEFIEDYLINGAKGKKWTAANAAAGSVGKGDSVRASEKTLAQREEFMKKNFWRSRQYQSDFDKNGIEGKFWTNSEPAAKGKPISQAEMHYRAEALKSQKQREHDEYVKKNWWKAPEVRADFAAHGVNSKLLRAATASVAALGLGGNPEYQANEAEINARAAFLQSGAADDRATEGEFSRELANAEEYWQKSDAVDDFIKNGAKGKKWRAATAAAGASEKGDAFPASDDQLALREAFLKKNFWRGSEFADDFAKNGVNGKKWKAADASGNGSISTEEELERFQYFTRAAREEQGKQAYAKENWWKSPEVQADFQANGRNGKLVRAATAAVAALNLGQQEMYQATPEELEARVAFFESNGREDRVPQALLSAQISSVKALGSNFWHDPEYIEDFIQNGAKGKKWTAADAAAASTAKGDQFRASADEIAAREEYFKSNFWKAPSCEADFLNNGSAGYLWSNSDANAKGYQLEPSDLSERFGYYTKALGESQERDDHIKNNWWKSPEAIADFKAKGSKSKFVNAATAEAALADTTEPAFQASPRDVASRIKFFENMAKGEASLDENSSAAEILRAVKPIDDAWWRDSAFAKEYFNSKEADFWKNPDCIDDYLKNGKNGKKWNAKNSAAGTTARGDKFPASADELKERESFYKENFWKAPAYLEDFEKNGFKGTLWTNSEPNGKGQPVSEGEMKARSMYFKPQARWQQNDKPSFNEKLAAADPVEAAARNEWFEQNWWKAPELKDDFEKNGAGSQKIKAATLDVLKAGLYNDPKFQASATDIKKRIEYFENLSDNEWWKNPSVVADYVKNKDEGAVWKSRNFKDSQMSMGAENPAHEAELRKRRGWLDKNSWKTPEAILDYQQNGNKGKLWKKATNGEGDAPADELKQREVWFADHKIVNADEEARRKEWLQQQLTDEEKAMRRDHIIRRAEDAKKIHMDELADCLAHLNDGERPSEDQIRAIEEAVMARREELGLDVDAEGITQEEFVAAVADTNFYIGATDEERERAEAEALEALHKEEMARLEEEAAYLAMEAEEELAAAGGTYEDGGEEEANEEEKAYMQALEDEQNAEAHVNEDDVQYTDQDEEAWKEYLAQEEGEAVSEEELARLQAEEEARVAEEAARDAAEQEAWQSEEIGGEEGEEDAAANEADLKEEVKEELEAVVNDEGWGEGEGEEWDQPAEEVVDEMQQEEKGQPMQWKLPLPEVKNPQFLKAYFTVIKYTPSHSFLGGKQKRVWVVDHFTRCFYNLEKNGKIKKEHAANKLLQLERNLLDSTRLRLMFFDAAHSYELQFFNTEERERFYETASAIRPSIRVYSPDLTNQDASVEACTTTIDGIGPNAVTVNVKNLQGKDTQRELTGECKVNASKLLTEPLTIWCGTFNLSGMRPPRKQDDLKEWMPRDKYDVYAVAVQEASFRKEESEWFEYVQNYLGKDYLTLASMFLWDTMLIVLTRKKHLLKITNVEGSTKATVHKQVCGTKGGIGISIRYLETSICFVTCHLAARAERAALRNTNLEEIVDCLQLGIRETDICNQFNHVFFFGDMNYRIETDPTKAAALIKDKKYAELLCFDQLLNNKASEGIMHGFQEPPITFAPTYRLDIGKQEKYALEKGNASSYCDRVLSRSMANTWVKCTSYKSSPSVTCSEHQPVAATFIIRCVRPVLACFAKVQEPLPEFVFERIQVRDSTGPIIKKPSLLINTPFTQIYKPAESKTQNTPNPVWNEAEIPKLTSVSQVKEYVETCHIILIFRDAAEKRDDKSHRGTALITLFGRVNEMQGVMQEFESDILCHGKSIGKAVGKFSWRPGQRQLSNPDK